MTTFWFYTLLLLILGLIIFYSYNSRAREEVPGTTITPRNWAERLGYPTGKRVIVLHADDIGMCPEANISAKQYLRDGIVQSASVMMPCQYAEDFIVWAKDNPTKDVGLHLTLNSEWDSYRWGPLSDVWMVPGLIDQEEKLWRTREHVVRCASPEEVEIELRAQIEKATGLGYRPNHLDTHMGTLYGSHEFTAVYLKLAEEYRIPAMVVDVNNPIMLQTYRDQGFPIDSKMIELINNYKLPKVDFFIPIDGNANSYKEKRKDFFELINSLPSGLTEIFFHPSKPTENLKSITREWKQRGWEAKLFEDPKVKAFLEREDILLTDWKEIMNRFEKINL